MVCEHSHLLARAGIARGNVQTYWLLEGLASLAESRARGLPDQFKW